MPYMYLPQAIDAKGDKTMRHSRKKTPSASALRPRIERLSWQRLTEIYVTTRSPAVKKMIEKEARRCGYRMSGFILAETLNRQSI